MKEPPQFYVDKPIFRGAQNLVMRCQVEGCGWHASGARDQLKLAWNEHYRQFHSQEVGTVIFDRRLRDELWLPGWRKS